MSARDLEDEVIRVMAAHNGPAESGVPYPESLRDIARAVIATVREASS